MHSSTYMACTYTFSRVLYPVTTYSLMHNLFHPGLRGSLGEQEGAALSGLEHVAEEEQLVGTVTSLLCLITQLSDEWAEFSKTAF